MVQTWERIQMCILETKVNGEKKGCSEKWHFRSSEIFNNGRKEQSTGISTNSLVNNIGWCLNMFILVKLIISTSDHFE